MGGGRRRTKAMRVESSRDIVRYGPAAVYVEPPAEAPAADECRLATRHSAAALWPAPPVDEEAAAGGAAATATGQG